MSFVCLFCFVCLFFVSVVKLDCFDVLCWRAYLTYSADFQKCPGWERRRFRLGNFSSKSTSLEKLGRSSGLYAQHRSRISWKTREQMSQTYLSIKIPKGKELEIIIPSHFRYCLEVRRKAKLNEIKRKLALQARQ